jgi:hypothetical protein
MILPPRGVNRSHTPAIGRIRPDLAYLEGDRPDRMRSAGGSAGRPADAALVVGAGRRYFAVDGKLAACSLVAYVVCGSENDAYEWAERLGVRDAVVDVLGLFDGELGLA